MMRYVIVSLLMLATAVSGYAIKPTDFLVNHSSKLILTQAIPNEFGDWKVASDVQQTIIEPEQEALINMLYSQTYSHTFINKITGVKVMLSLAYGEIQTDGKEVHKPDLCYPAQGFTIDEVKRVELNIGTNIPTIHGNQLVARMNARVEPIIYWTTLGTHTYSTRMQKKSTELQYALNNLIPDGMLFRVSVIDSDIHKGNLTLQRFIKDLYKGTQPQYQQRIFGS